MTVVDLKTGAIGSTILPIFQTGTSFKRFLGVDDNDNFLILVQSVGLGVATITPSGKLVTAPVYAGPIFASYTWYYTSYQYDSNRDSVYLVVSGPRLFEYEFNSSSTDTVPLAMPNQINTPNGCFDGVDNYYFMQIADNTYSQFFFSHYSLKDQEQHGVTNVTGIAPDSYTYLFCANKEVYVVAYNIDKTSDMSLYLLDTDDSSATLSYNQDTGLPNSLNLWFIDNYFVFLSENDNNEYYLTTVDLNTNTVVSKTQVQGTFALRPDASGVY
ncbi:hypothetical protein DFA_08746 [Cavenderia fasciculata]|uniref:Uncharacterized protein n=1 Tax=Cavenderia fasciculata TaxID=261658 RepID=F4Q445_CACFS|nr:uncharacterized protein DFA_08746 [Cavenderia fasciculata]EGG17747.1 hypothetical protein DFA_08746 [Cavenderia fasciculata]|eukprot:XP_004356231.1 hypothetical protein DFA_08746 [Cavenderia fasciculata]